MKIVIDAMGGDNAPASTVEGAIAAATEWADTQIVLIGDEAKLEPLLSQSGVRPANLTVRHASEVIGSDDEPVKAVRRKKDASMVVAGRMLKEGEADAMISAGNTGALMTAGLLVVGRMAGIERPALAPMIPTIDDVGVLALDLGANMDAKPEHLAQYGLMGSLYRQKVQGIESPRVGLLNVGTEPGKGNELTKHAYPLLEQLPIRFVGNVEARDVLTGACDVLVCDGFAGNILLKSLEGTAGAIFALLKEQFSSSLKSKLAAAVLMPELRGLKRKLDYTEHGGAPLLGLSRLVVKSHGSADGNAIKNAVRQARIAVQNQLVESISKEISGK
ncbi:phosphate acyltransferase PlsX [Paenibacillus sp. FSL H8-0317]|uniref:Phosphate acyltransferase n=1 Tax=Paenibacillus xylanexedens TaxID=528191 RepID=A0ABS4RPG8_PAEXY|nr:MULTISPECIES: phosphate acyltransferase PlsX [Paenibacillus]APO45148.1 phosphate acyltransferase [Paenibacillus xylanexedens]KLU53948.1 phosphate acyltransferase [Paenibacillus sp. VT-400]MBP2244788.1 glycerol-3-phosphate acyltransferase PlsX [Paenibacillus xylanexedens]MBY0119058.1 phosphate acyltransferase PlsX [Paenibacillus xylanexedens]